MIITTNNHTKLEILEVPKGAYGFGWHCLYDWTHFHLIFFVEGLSEIYSRYTYDYPCSRVPYLGPKMLYNLPKIIGSTSSLTDDQIKPYIDASHIWDGIYKEYFLDFLDFKGLSLQEKTYVILETN